MTDTATVRAGHARVLTELTGAGDWWNGPERRALLAEARSPGTGADVPPAAVEVVRRIVDEPTEIDRPWATARIAELDELGDGADRYAEIVGITGTLTVLDTFAVAVGEPPLPLPAGQPGAPAGARPRGVGDVGAWIPMTVDKALANVSRALSLVPRTNATWRTVVTESYSRGPEMMELSWNRALSRPQIELIAATVSRHQECFY